MLGVAYELGCVQFAGLCVSVCQYLVPVCTSLWCVLVCVLGVVGRPSVPRRGPVCVIVFGVSVAGCGPGCYVCVCVCVCVSR